MPSSRDFPRNLTGRRENNITVLGVPDDLEAVDGATTDEGKLRYIWKQRDVSDVQLSHHRFGKGASTQRWRSIRLTLWYKELQTRVLDRDSRLKTRGERYGKIFF